ncbi:TPA: DUF3265 domain-containing protein [Vibrio vulnificus]|nr:DUF3265 domain-containing protein [Vibrio vulnificus]
MARKLTNNLRVIRHAWHFWHAVSFGGESGLRKAGLGGIHPLTQRYVPMRSIEL